MVTRAEQDWVYVPEERQPQRTGVGGGFRLGVLWPECVGGDFDLLDPSVHEWLSQTVEEVGVDFILFPDDRLLAPSRRPTGLRPALWSVPIITSTSRLGVVTSLPTTFLHPTQIARFGAHLDWLSGGRWAWSVVTGGGDRSARLHGLAACPDLATRSAQAEESVAAVLAVWGSGEQGVEVEGATYRIRGRFKRPTVIQRPHPPLIGSGRSPEARALAARHLDAWITQILEVDGLRAAAIDLGQGRAEGRPPVRVIQHVRVEVRARGRGVEAWVPGVDMGLVDHAQTLVEAGAAGALLVEFTDWTQRGLEALAYSVERLTECGVLEAADIRGLTW